MITIFRFRIRIKIVLKNRYKADHTFYILLSERNIFEYVMHNEVSNKFGVIIMEINFR